MEPFLIHGPGSHAHLIESFFVHRFRNWTSARQWPDLAITKHAGEAEPVVTLSRSYAIISFLAYAINNRMSPFTGGRQLQFDVLTNYYDHLCSREVLSSKKLLAWAQVSLKSLKRNKELGGISILEHPMPHVDHWMRVNQRFYDDQKFPVKPGYSRFSSRMIRRMKAEYSTADYIQVHSSFARQTFVNEGFDPSRLLITQLGIDPREFPYHNNSRQPSSRLRIAFVGRLELFKGVHLLLDIARKHQGDQIEWKLIGRVLPEIKPFLKGIANIEVTGGLDREQISRHLLQTDLLVFPSLNDAFGLVILEAMLHGVPVIASTASAGPDIISHLEDGLLVQANSSAALEQAIYWVVENKQLLPAMGERARKKVHEKYLKHHYFSRLESNLQQAGFLP